jgi:hypothetical protein
MGDRLRKSGKLRILKIPIGKSGRMVEIGKIPPESGKLAGMQKVAIYVAYFLSTLVMYFFTFQHSSTVYLLLPYS